MVIFVANEGMSILGRAIYRCLEERVLEDEDQINQHEDRRVPSSPSSIIDSCPFISLQLIEDEDQINQHGDR